MPSCSRGSRGAESLSPAFASETLQSEHALLAEALRLLEVSSVREELRMPIELLERAIGVVDAVEIQHEATTGCISTRTFSALTTPSCGKTGGVYYTPVEVVRLQVRLAAELLRTRFNKRLAFADDDVVVLDPAVGTGTYPLAVLDHAGRRGTSAPWPRCRPPEAARPRRPPEWIRAARWAVLGCSPARLATATRCRRVRPTGADLSHRYPGVSQPVCRSSGPASCSSDSPRSANARRKSRRKCASLSASAILLITVICETRGEADSGRRKGGWVRHGDKGADQPPILEDFLKPVRDAGGGVHLKPLYNGLRLLLALGAVEGVRFQ